GTERARAHAALEPLDRPLGYEWANDGERVGSVTVDLVGGVDEAVELANRETSGLAAGIVAEDAEAAERFLDGYRGTAAFWHAPTRFTDGFALTGAPETGINVDWAPGPRGPVTYRDLWLRQVRVVGDGTQHRRTRPPSSSPARASSPIRAAGPGAPGSGRGRRSTRPG